MKSRITIFSVRNSVGLRSPARKERDFSLYRKARKRTKTAIYVGQFL
jgi:hypothetical protein